MLARYTDLIEGDNKRVSKLLAHHFDYAVEAYGSQSDRPVQMEGGDPKTSLLQQLSMEMGVFAPQGLHPGLADLFRIIASSLRAFIELHEDIRQLRAAQSSLSEAVSEAGDTGTQATRTLARAQKKFEISERRSKRTLQEAQENIPFRYQSILASLRIARDNFADDTIGALRGVTVTGDRLKHSTQASVQTNSSKTSSLAGSKR